MSGYRVIYEPAGAAAEYAELACNPRLTCSHGCTYCYCPGVLRKAAAEFHCEGPARRGILEKLRRDAADMAAAGDRRRVQFCFIGDPYDPADYLAEVPAERVTRPALAIMVEHGLNFTVLTKGGLRAERDFDLLPQGGQLGVSMVWASEFHREQEEPGTQSLRHRLQSIEAARQEGIYCWASVEPVKRTNEALAAIRQLAVAGVGEVRVGIARGDGPWNPDMWRRFGEDLAGLLGDRRLPYQIKASLQPYWPEETATDTREVRDD